MQLSAIKSHLLLQPIILLFVKLHSISQDRLRVTLSEKFPTRRNILKTNKNKRLKTKSAGNVRKIITRAVLVGKKRFPA